jgi:hypothetical protein
MQTNQALSDELTVYQVGGRYFTASGEQVTIELISEEEAYQKGILHRQETRDESRVREIRMSFEFGYSIPQLEQLSWQYSPRSEEGKILAQVIKDKIAAVEAEGRALNAEELAAKKKGIDGTEVPPPVLETAWIKS